MYSKTIPTGRSQLNEPIEMHYFSWEACVGTDLRKKDHDKENPLSRVFSIHQLLCLKMFGWGISVSLFPPSTY